MSKKGGKNILVLIPNSLEWKRNGAVEGFYKEYQDCLAYFITSDKIIKHSSKSIGYISVKEAKDLKSVNDGHWLHINPSTSEITIPRLPYTKILKIYYELDVFSKLHKQSNVMEFGVHFQELINYFRTKHVTSYTNGTKGLIELVVLFIIKFLDVILKVIKYKDIIKYSSTINYFEESCLLGRWMLTSFINKTNGPKLSNFLVAIAVDLIMGLCVIKYFVYYKKDVLYFIEDSGEVAIITLKELLNYLMGSPIGLKLNHAFNHALGSFFFYNINLWRMFIQGLFPTLLTYMQFLVKLGVFGFSFQLAIISDVLSLTTFHVYCIYVYAAKLFQLQLRSIVSLWRLFIGRKYNPLRERVDSCQYSQHQLFIGTLGFTIFLFLLPTTTLYYVVFTTLRIIFLTINGILYRVRYVLRCLPLYITLLWLFNSPTLAGILHLEIQNSEQENSVSVAVKLKMLPLWTGIKTYSPDVIHPVNGFKWGTTIHRLFTGVLI